ncbi:MAG: sigma 54-interacting transcriptional regulator [Planctomycetota bacterium]
MSLSRVVVISKDPDVQQLAQHYSREVFGADDLEDALDIVQTANPDLVLFDQRFGKGRIGKLLGDADKRTNSIPVVVVGSEGSDSGSSSEYLRAGAFGYLRTSRDRRQMERIIDRIEKTSGVGGPDADGENLCSIAHCEEETQRFFAESIARSVSMVGKSEAMLSSLKMIKLVASSRCNPILIVGETGTGKELVAKAVHTVRHAGEQFVAVNCAALTASLLESELFGHVKGAFTGADRDKTGLLELAGSGTLLLDEISEMPVDLQAKLLRVLQDRSFRKVGGVKDIKCKATIIASSNRNLKNEVEAKRFREDLYYRLNIGPIVLAPLRAPARRDDIKLLAEYFLKTSAICPEKRDKVISLTKLAMENLERYDWPGNVRELRNVIERAMLLETTDKIGLSGIVLDPTQCAQASENPSSGLIKGFSLARAERELIARALKETGWQKTRAAALLGITRATLYAKVKQYNIERESNCSEARKPAERDDVLISSLHEPAPC